MLEGNKMCKLLTKPPDLQKNLQSLHKREILEVKRKKNVSFLEARKIVGTYIGENS